jgi:parallel beta-helix repeat protein
VDDSDSLVIRGNHSHDNGNHGIICSQRCDHLTIEGNTAENNVGHGIMLHRSVTATTVRDNITRNNTDTGLALFESFDNVIDRNTVTGNLRGIRLSVGSARNLFTANVVTRNTSYGIYFYQGSDVPAVGSGRPSDNVFRGNSVTDNRANGVYGTDTDRNEFAGNDFARNTAGLYLGRGKGNVVSGVTPDALKIMTAGSDGAAADTAISAFGTVVVQLTGAAKTTLRDAAGRVFDIDETIGTTVTPTASSLTVDVAKIGTSTTAIARPLQVTTDSGNATVDPTGWKTAAGTDPAWSTKPGVKTQLLRHVVSGLTPGATYKVKRNGTTILTKAAGGDGKLSFDDRPNTTGTVTYAVTA